MKLPVTIDGRGEPSYLASLAINALEKHDEGYVDVHLFDQDEALEFMRRVPGPMLKRCKISYMTWGAPDYARMELLKRRAE